ncbi:MAG TPA: winged helix-turn-helix domain-containing protein [Chloroflexota bacterium]|nr:winged helix-turn-helix domain-containing protein [Chloroflexota bacterium]
MPTMSYYQAAVEILRSTGRPMGAYEIADEALRRGLIAPEGKTPRNTMSAALLRHTLGGSSDIVRQKGQGRNYLYAARRSVKK